MTPLRTSVAALPDAVALPTVLILLALAAPTSPARAQIVVDDRTVETKAAGGCTDDLVVGNQRYVDCGNGTIWDLYTQLIWLQDASCDSLGPNGNATGTWSQAQSAAAGLAHGHDCDLDGTADLTDGSQPGDWRLPTRQEWEDTIEQAVIYLGCEPTLTDLPGTACHNVGPAAFTGLITTPDHWSGTSDVADPFDAHVIDLFYGTFSAEDKLFAIQPPQIWPVRPANSDAVLAAARVEGAAVETAADGPCYDDLGLGTERYLDCGDGTVLDTVTGLLWLQDASCWELPGLDVQGKGTWLAALGAVAGLHSGLCGLTDGSQAGDWRLATESEWAATIARAVALGCTGFGAGDPPALTDTAGTGCLAAGSTPFVTVLADYWTSTVAIFDTSRIIDVNLTSGDLDIAVAKSNANRVAWPVRERR